jgi:hypothetical protein
VLVVWGFALSWVCYDSANESDFNGLAIILYILVTLYDYPCQRRRQLFISV